VCMYNHNRTATGGRMSRDFTNGYGPEEYLLKKALPGTYVIKAKYFGSSRQKVSGPVVLSLQLFHDYGTGHEKMEEITIRLADAKEVITIGEFVLE
jgi:Ca-activated chloride channel family protein